MPFRLIFSVITILKPIPGHIIFSLFMGMLQRLRQRDLMTILCLLIYDRIGFAVLYDNTHDEHSVIDFII